MAKDWYSPGEIHFSIRTARWLIQNLGSLRDGHWPPEASNYIDIPGTKSSRRRAPFATPIEYAAEIETRLEKCGLDGLVLEAIECWGKSEASMASYFKVEERTIAKRQRIALGYVASGPDRRWHDTRNKRGKLKRKGETYQEFRARKKRIKTRRKI